MSVDVQQEMGKEDKPLTRADVERLLREVGSPDKLDLSYRNLRGIDLTDFDLTRATLREANLIDADLGGTILREANLSGSYLRFTRLEGTDLNGADLSDAHLERARLSGVDLTKANLGQANFNIADLSGADLSGANLSEHLMSGANLSRANLRGADLSGTNLHTADLFGADLTKANLREADLSKASLNGADLRGADLNGANLSGADLTGVLISRESEKAILDAMNVISSDETRVLGDARTQSVELRIRINEDPLPAQSLATIMSALTELFTKFWLIQQGRFPDLVEYALTHDARFTKEANIVITQITRGSSFDFKFDVSLNPETAVRATQILYDMKKLEAERKEEARLKNKALEEEIEHKRLELQALLAGKAVDRQIKVEEAYLKSQEAYLKLQNELTALEERRLKLRREEAEFELDFINRALDTAKKLVDVFYPSVDVDQKAIGARIILNNLLQVNGIEQLDFILSLPQGTGNKKPGEEV